MYSPWVRLKTVESYRRPLLARMLRGRTCDPTTVWALTEGFYRRKGEGA